MDAETHGLFAACDNRKLAVMDAESGKMVATFAMGLARMLAFDPVAEVIFISNGEDGTF